MPSQGTTQQKSQKQQSNWEQSDSDDDGQDGIASPSEASLSSEDEGETEADVEADEDEEGPEEVRQTFAQFQGESDLEDDSDEEDEEASEDESEDSEDEDEYSSDEERQGATREKQLRQQMASVPFGDLVKARRSLAKDDEEEEDFSEEDEWAADRARAAVKSGKVGSSSQSRAGPSSSSLNAQQRAVQEHLRALKSRGSRRGDDDSDASESEGAGPSQERRERRMEVRQGRDHKHAPTEVSSRRPVSRKRSVIDISSLPGGAAAAGGAPPQRRDPRFSNLSGNEINSGMFSKAYSFLSEARDKELKTLKQTLSRLRKLEANHAGPRAQSESALKLRAEREAVERTLKREEAKQAERQKRDREQELLRNFKKSQEEKIREARARRAGQEGEGGDEDGAVDAAAGKRFYLKKSAQRELFLQDKFARLAAGKGKGAHQRSQTSGATAAGAAPIPESSNSKALRKALDKRRKKDAAKERKQMPFLDAGRRPEPGGGAGLPGLGGAIPKRKRQQGQGQGPSSSNGPRQGEGNQGYQNKRKRGARGAGAR